MLEPVRAFAFGQGVRAPTLGGVRPGDRLPERVAGSGIPHSTYQVIVPLVGRPSEAQNAGLFSLDLCPGQRC